MRALDPIRVPLEGTQLIEASAGTGKTYTITTLVLRLLLEGDYSIDAILVVTYTRAATAELRDRIRRRLADALIALDVLEAGGEVADATLSSLLAGRSDPETRAADRVRLRRAMHRLDEAAVFTIHGFCQRALADGAFESGLPFEMELAEDATAMVAEVVQDFWARHAYDEQPLRVAYWQEHGAGPRTLGSVVRRASSDPNLAVLPEAPPDYSPADLDAWYAARDEAAQLWRAGRADVLALLTEPKRLHAGSYKPGKIRGEWAPQLDALSQLRPGGLPMLVERVSASDMRNRVLQSATRPEHPFFHACDRLWAAELEVRATLEHDVVSMRTQVARYAAKEQRRRKLERGLLGFDDLMVRLDEALSGPLGPGLAQRLRSTYRVALIDEFQDTDPMQYRIFRRIYAADADPLFLIGDPKQAIYGFRGADVFAYMEAVSSADENAYTLTTNYRSDPGLLSAHNAVFGDARDPFLFQEIGYHPVQAPPDTPVRISGPGGDAPLQLLWVPPASAGATKRIGKGWASAQLPASTAAEIATLLTSQARIEGRPIEPRDIAVLCRTNKQARATQTALRQLGVPAVLEGDDSVFDSEMAGELQRLLSAMAHPGDARKVRSALVTSLLGLSAAELDSLQGDEADWDRWLSLIHGWNATWLGRGFVQALHQVLAEAHVQRRLLRLPDGERRLTNLLHLGELAHEAATQQHLGPLSLIAWLRDMRLDDETRGGWVGESAQVRLESDARAVRLTTVHKSKGLEYPVVYCPFLWDGNLMWGDDVQFPRFHDNTVDRRLTVDLGSDAVDRHRVLAASEALAEQLRLVYVALTRAKHRCYVVWGAFSGSEKSALAYLLHQGERASGSETEDVAVARRVKSLTADEMLGELGELSRRTDGAIGVRAIWAGAPETAPRFEAPAGPAALTVRAAPPFVRGRFRVASFSSLTASGPVVDASPSAPEGDDVDVSSDAQHYAAEVLQEEGIDHDGDTAVAGGGGAGSSGEASALSAVVPLSDFPAGTRAGSMLHHVYEHIDFAADRDAVAAQVAVSLAQFGYSASLARTLVAPLLETLRVELPWANGANGANGESGVCLRDVARADRVDELEFTLRVAHGGESMTCRGLGAVLSRHGAPTAMPAYAQRVEQLGAPALSGFLRGYIDLLFRHEGRYYVVDYKSNHLGPDAADYMPPRLAPAMAAHDYYLQYLFYVVAVHRHLQTRLLDYDYDRHFGGVYYLFLRGMAPQHAAGCGVFQDRPRRELVEALAALVEGGGA